MPNADILLARLRACLMRLGPDPHANMATLLALCDELPAARAALYARQTPEAFRILGAWNLPPDFPQSLPPDDPLCRAVLADSAQMTAVTDLDGTALAALPNLTGCLGQVIAAEGADPGILLIGCTETSLGDEARQWLALIAAAVGVEAQRHAADLCQQQMEMQLRYAQKLESIGQLAAGIAHEINTPTQFVGDNLQFLRESFGDLLTVLNAYARLCTAAETGAVPGDVLAGVRAAEQTADLEYLREDIPNAIAQSLDGVARVARIVRAMKEFSHPDTGERVSTNLNQAIESTVTVAHNEWKYLAALHLDLDPALPRVVCSPGDINQVILNLVINAAHAIGDVVGDGAHGLGAITISTRHDDEMMEIRIADTGSGIPEAVRGRIFDPFFTTKPVGKGTGQGLAIAYNIVVHKHGGTLSFDTETGVGTTFIIRLPIEAPNTTPSE